MISNAMDNAAFIWDPRHKPGAFYRLNALIGSRRRAKRQYRRSCGGYRVVVSQVWLLSDDDAAFVRITANERAAV